MPDYIPLEEVQRRNAAFGQLRDLPDAPESVSREAVVRASMEAAKTHKKPLLELVKLIDQTGTDPYPWHRLSPLLQKLLAPKAKNSRPGSR